MNRNCLAILWMVMGSYLVLMVGFGAPASAEDQGGATSRPGVEKVILVSPEDQAAINLLDHPVPKVELPHVAFEDSIDFLRDISGANIYVDWKALQAVHVTEKTAVTESLRNKKLSFVLKDIFAQVGGELGYEVRGGVIVISSFQQLALEKRRPGPDLRQARNITDPRLSRQDGPVEAKLERVLPSIQLPKVPLADAIDFMRDITSMNILVNWKAMRQSGIDRQTPVTFTARNIKTSTVLDFLLNEAGDGKLGYCIDRGVVAISTIDDLRASGKAPTTAPSPR